MKKLLLLSIFCLCLAPLTGQDDPIDISESFTVSAAAVEVVVTDAKGQRVTELPKNAFHLYVDQVEQPLSYFMEIRGQSGQAESPAHVINEAEMPRNFLVFIDDWFTQRPYRARLFKRLVEDIEAMRPIDRMAIVRYRGKGVELLSDWTSDKIQLRDIIDAAAEMVPGEKLREAQLDHNSVDFNRPIHRTSGGDETRVLMERRNERSRLQKGEVLSSQIKGTAEVVEVAMRSFAGVDGRKSLLLLSSGWPYDIANLYGLGTRLGSNEGDRFHLLRPVSDTANQLGFTIYPLLLGQVKDGLAESNLSQSSDFAVSYQGMKFLADQTGGAVVNKAQFKELPLTQVVQDQSGYYILGFVTSDLIRGIRHRVEVKLPGYDYKVRHRQDFRATTAAEQADLSARTILLTGLTANDLDVSLGAPQRYKFGQVTVPVSVVIPLDWTGFESAGDQFAVRLTLRVAAEDKNGHQSEMVRAPIELKGPRPSQGATTTYEASILVAKRKQRLVFTLQDEISGSTLSRTLEFVP